MVVTQNQRINGINEVFVFFKLEENREKRLMISYQAAHPIKFSFELLGEIKCNQIFE